MNMEQIEGLEQQASMHAAVPDNSQPQLLHLTLNPISSHLIKASITVNPSIVEPLWLNTVEIYRHDRIEGFDQTTIPAEYVSEVFRGEIQNKIKHYLFNHIVIDFLFNELIKQKIAVANTPRLSFIETQCDEKLVYHFNISTSDLLELKDWKLFAFKSPKRKRYKDLDKQVIAFMENRAEVPPILNTVTENDWVMFQATPVNESDEALSAHLASSFWIFTQRQEVIEPFIIELLGKKLDEVFFTTAIDLYQDEIKAEHHSYRYRINILAIVKGANFCLETFKTTFKLKNKIDVHNKLMEVFSYRNDISQRKAIIEEVFHLLLSKHRFEIPKHLILRREEDLLATMLQQPDYHVYKAQTNFTAYIELLAEKQLKEEIIIDQIAHQENIRPDVRDISQYFHLLSNKRLQEFVYFKPIFLRSDRVESPINLTTISHVVMREKTLNYIVHVLTR
jgi:FKBP-type peptidyl-prolyl cis-trans isomerase (trigger factor)